MDSDFGTTPQEAETHPVSRGGGERSRAFSYTPLALMVQNRTSFTRGEGPEGLGEGLSAEDLEDFGVSPESYALSRRNTVWPTVADRQDTTHAARVDINDGVC